MRLIDADALSDAMYRKSFETDDGRNKWLSGLWIRYKIFEEALAEAQTHGRWDCDMGGAWCSVCGEYSEAKFEYCPHCSAQMDL